MIGLSLSLCVLDIIEGRVDVSAVDKLITGTMIETPTHMEKVLGIYMEHYWDNNPQAIAVVHALWREGKIEQPRVKGQPPPDLSNGHWLED